MGFWVVYCSDRLPPVCLPWVLNGSTRAYKYVATTYRTNRSLAHSRAILRRLEGSIVWLRKAIAMHGCALHNVIL